MKCPYCDQEIADGSASCPECGKELTSNQPVQTEQSAASEAASENQPAAETTAAGAPASGSPAEAAGQNGGKKKWMIGAIIAALVVIVAGAAMFMPKKKDPKDAVIDAFKSIVAEGQTNPMEEIFGFKAMGEKLTKESSEMQMSFRLEDISEESLKAGATGEITFDMANDVANKKMDFVMGVNYADMVLATMDIYLDQEKLAVAIPELSGNVFTLNYADDLEGQIQNSPYLGQYVAESGLDVTGLNSYLEKCNEMASSGKQLFNLKELWTRYKEGSKAIDDLKAAMTVEKADKKEFTINGKGQNCDGYNVTITKDALIQFLTTTKEFFLTDETLKKDFVEYIDLVTTLQSSMMMYGYYGMEDMTPEQMQEKAWSTVEEQVDMILEQLKESLSDVNMVVYVTNDGKMASFDYDTTAVIADETIKIYGTVTFAGGYSMKANVNATLNMEDATGDTIKFVIDKTGAYESGKTYEGALNASMSMGDESFSMKLDGDYNVESKNFNLSADFAGNDVSVLKITSTGVINNLVKGESIDLSMDTLNFELSGMTDRTEYLNLSGTYKMAPLSRDVKIPEGEEMDILAATEADWEEVGAEIMGNAFGLIMSLQQ